MVVAQQLVKEINSLVADKTLVVGVDKAVPGLLLEPTQDIVVLSIQLYLVLVQVVEQLVRAENLGNLYKLVRVRIAVEKRLLAEDHRGEHGSKGPHVQAVVVLLEIDQQLRALEIPGRDTDVVLSSWMVKLGQTPINQAQLQAKFVSEYPTGGWADVAGQIFKGRGKSTLGRQYYSTFLFS